MVVGEGAGVSKLRKAAALGVRQLTAEAFAAMVRDPEAIDVDEPLGVVAAAPAAVTAPASSRPTGAHGAGSSSWMRDGRYVTVVNCRCGWKSEADRYNDARTQHSAHREAVADPDLALDETVR